MQDFKMSGSNMNELLTNMKAIKERIDDSYDELTRLMLRIESDESVSYTHLTLPTIYSV